MLQPVSPEAARITFWWWLMFWISAFVFALVTVLLLLGLRRRRVRLPVGPPAPVPAQPETAPTPVAEAVIAEVDEATGDAEIIEVIELEAEPSGDRLRGQQPSGRKARGRNAGSARPASREDGQETIAKRNERRWLRFVIFGGIVAPAIILSSLMGVNLFSERVIAASAERPSLTVQIIGHQWWWEIRYPDQGVVTANELHVPVGQQIKLELSSADVIHSFWAPQLEGKRDLIPGQTNILTFTPDRAGIYRGQCAEYCGRMHAKMAFLVVAEPPDVFAEWVTAQQQPAAAPVTAAAQAGEQVFLHNACVACHTVAGTAAAGKIGPDLTHIASRYTLAAATLSNTPAHRAGWIVNSQALKPGNAMPVMQLQPADLQSLLAWLETLK
jgi:cytochrome c oxidase subunit 2